MELTLPATQHTGQGEGVQGEGLFLGTRGWKILPGAGLQGSVIPQVIFR